MGEYLLRVGTLIFGFIFYYQVKKPSNSTIQTSLANTSDTIQAASYATLANLSFVHYPPLIKESSHNFYDIIKSLKFETIPNYASWGTKAGEPCPPW